MSVFLIAPLFLLILCPFLVYLFRLSKKRTTLSSNDVSVLEQTETKKHKTKSKSKQSSTPTKKIVKPEVKAVLLKPAQKLSEASVASIGQTKPLAQPKPLSMASRLNTIEFEECDEKPPSSGDWIPADKKHKVKQTEKKPLPEQTIALKPPVMPVVPNQKQKPIKESAPQPSVLKNNQILVTSHAKTESPVSFVASSPTLSTHAPSSVLYEMIVSERNALRKQVDLLQSDLNIYIDKYNEAEQLLVASQRKQPKNTASSTPIKIDQNATELQKKLLDANKEIEQLKRQLEEKSQQRISKAAPDDAVVVTTLQMEIANLSRKLTIANQRSESLQVRLDYSEKEKQKLVDAKNNNLHLQQEAASVAPVNGQVAAAVESGSKKNAAGQKQAHQEKTDKSAASEKVKILEQQLADSQTLAQSKQAEISQLQLTLQDLQSTQRDHADKQAQMTKLEQKLLEMQTKQQDHEKRQAQIVELERKLQEMQAEKQKQALKRGEHLNGNSHNGEQEQETDKKSPNGSNQKSQSKVLCNGDDQLQQLKHKQQQQQQALNEEIQRLVVQNEHYQSLLRDTEKTLSGLQTTVEQEHQIWCKDLEEERARRNKLELELQEMREKNQAGESNGSVHEASTNGYSEPNSMVDNLKSQLADERGKSQELNLMLNKLRSIVNLGQEELECEKKTSEELRAKIRQLNC